jgi:hypothetical protein
LPKINTEIIKNALTTEDWKLAKITNIKIKINAHKFLYKKLKGIRLQILNQKTDKIVKL